MSDDLAEGLIQGPDKQPRCWWHSNKPIYQHYHDTEWGWPVANDRTLFEKICLEGFQAGLSWLTILNKRDNFRAAFANFEIDAIVQFDENDITRLLNNAGIVRHEGKIRSTINNAQRAQDLIQEFGSLAAYFWRFEPTPEERPVLINKQALMALTQAPASIRLSKDLKKRGWSFVGPTTVYAFMQAMGLVNDHLDGCICRDTVQAARARFTRPTQS